MNLCTISCELYDYLEIACLYGYQVRLKLKDGQQIEGKAVDIATVEKREYLLICNDKQHSIDLTQLAKLQVQTPHAKFSKVNFLRDLRHVSAKFLCS